MNIGMILDNEFTGDMRVENEVVSLREAGHKVYDLCFNHGNKLDQEDYHGANIIRILMGLSHCLSYVILFKRYATIGLKG